MIEDGSDDQQSIYIARTNFVRWLSKITKLYTVIEFKCNLETRPLLLEQLCHQKHNITALVLKTSLNKLQVLQVLLSVKQVLITLEEVKSNSEDNNDDEFDFGILPITYNYSLNFKI